MSIAVIAICPAAHLDAINAVLEAMGKGPGNISRKLTTVANPTWDATPTHYFMSDQSVSTEYQAQLLGFSNGDLPPLPEGKVWGEDGVISAADAMAAIPHLAVASFNEGYAPQQQLDAAMAAHDPVLHVIPFPEI